MGTEILEFVKTVFNVVIPVIFIVCVGLSAFRGWSRRGLKQLLHVACTVVAFIASFVIMKGSYTLLFDAFGSGNLNNFLAQFGINTEILAEPTTYVQGIAWILALPYGAFIVPIAFVILFFILRILMNIVYAFLNMFLPKMRGVLGKMAGLALGALEGALCLVVIALPFMGILGMVDDSVDKIRENEATSHTEFIEFYDNEIEPLNDSVTVTTLNTLGTDVMLDILSTFERDGKTINIRHEIPCAISVTADFITMGEVDWKALTPEQQEQLNSMVDTIGESEYLSFAISGVLSGMGRAAQDGIVPIVVEAPFDKLVSAVVTLFATSDEDNVAADIHSILEVYYILCDEGVLTEIEGGDSQALLDCLIAEKDGSTVISRIIETLKSNDHTKPLVAALTELSINIMSNQLGLGDDASEVYESVKTDMKDVLTIKKSDYPDTEEGQAQYKQDLTNSLDEKLKANDIELEPEIVSGIADYIDENIEEKDEYTDEEINDIILSYYDVYVDYQNAGQLPDGDPAS